MRLLKKSILTIIARCCPLIFLFVLSVFASDTLHSQTIIKDKVSGIFDVQSNGAGLYMYPIELPPGFQGMQPTVSLVYNSQSVKTNSIVGPGWSVSGISQIQRCGRIIATDGVAGSVNYDENDRYALDGQRLIVITGEYGADGAEYRTEKESWQKISSHGTCGSGPCYFRVVEKNGTVKEYGNTSDSRIEARAKTDVRVWAINKKIDRNENQMVYSYTDEGSTSQLYPDTISYAYNKDTGDYEYGISFNYDYRIDSYVDWVGGSQIITKWAVTSIDVVKPADATVLKSYLLNYEASPQTLRSRLISIQECSADKSLCYAPTEFTWQGSTLNDAMAYTEPEGEAYQNYLRGKEGDEEGNFGGATLILGDYNGDGKTDFIRQMESGSSTDTVTIYYSKGDGYYDIVAPAGGSLYDSPSDQVNLISGDFNGDGMDDFIRQEKGSYDDDDECTFQVYFSKGDGRFIKHVPENITSPNDVDFQTDMKGDLTQIIPGDFNGDGRTDFLKKELSLVGVTSFEVLLSRGDGNFDQKLSMIEGDSWVLLFAYNNTSTFIPGDFNGDGMTDFICQEAIDWDPADRAGNCKVMLAEGDGTFRFVNPLEDSPWDSNDFYQYWLRSDYGANIITGDFNGDGKTDFLRQEKGEWDDDEEHSIQVCISKGNGYFNILYLLSEKNEGNDLQKLMRADPGVNLIVADVNGDGRSDILRQEKGDMGSDDASTIHILYSVGTGSTFYMVSPHAPGENLDALLRYDPGSVLTISDVNGDGSTDFMRQERNGWASDTENSFGVLFSQITSERITTIKNGLGGDLSIEYKPITDSSVYTKKYYNKYPDVDIQSPFYVVSSMTESDGKGHTYTSSYHYAGARRSLNGRGFLGFTERTTTFSNGNKKLEHYITEYPANGVVSGVSHMDPSGNILHQTKQIYAVTASNWDKVLDKVMFVRKASEHIIEYQSDGSIAYEMESAFSYDNYGNITQIKDSGRLDIEGDELYHFSTFTNDTVNWNLGQVTQSLFTSDSAGKQLIELTKLEYDSNSNVSALNKWDSSRNEWSTSLFEYDQYGNLVKISGPADSLQIYEYEAGRLRKEKQYSSKDSFIETSYTYNDFGKLVKEQSDPAVTRYTYNEIGYLQEELCLEAKGSNELRRTQYSFGEDSLGFYREVRQLASGVDKDEDLANEKNWLIERKYIDGLGRVIRHTTQSGNTTVINREVQYDSAGRIFKESYPRYEGEQARWIEYGYDSRGHKNKIIEYAGTANARTTLIRISYDTSEDSAVKKTETIINSGTDSEIVRLMYHDCRGHVVKRVYPDGNSVSYTYAASGNVSSLILSDGQVTSLTFDTMGRKQEMDSPISGASTYSYTKNGAMAEVSDAIGQVTRFEYDWMNRPLVKELVDKGGTVVEKTVYTYDSTAHNAQGKMWKTEVYDVNSDQSTSLKLKVEVAYTSLGQINTLIRTIDDITYTESYKYDPLGRCTSMTYPDGSTLHYTYTDTGSISSLEMDGTEYANYSYSKSHFAKIEELEYGNGLVTSYTYDELSRLTDIKTGELTDNSYTWNDKNQITEITDNLDSARTQKFSYNDAGYLLTAESSGLYGSISYSYDQTGNLTAKTASSSNRSGLNYVEYRHMKTTNQLRSSNGKEYSYDANGNRISKVSGANSYTYSYDPANRLTKVEKNGESISQFEYADSDLRLKKYDADGTESVYVSQSYELVRFKDREQHTKYILGPQGKIAAITLDNPTAVAGVWDYSNCKRRAQMYNRSTLQGFFLYSYCKLDAFRVKPYFVYQALKHLFIIVLLLIAALTIVSAFRAASESSFVGRARRKLFIFLHCCGLIKGEVAEKWVKRYASEVVMRNFYTVFVSPFLLVCFLFLTGCSGSSSSKADISDIPTYEDQTDPTDPDETGSDAYGYPVLGTYYFHNDHIGSNNSITDVDGNEVSRAYYKPYGEIILKASSGYDIFRAKFTGKEWDKDTDLYFSNARYYDPETGRFITPDSYLQGGPNIGQVVYNRYAYAGNNPLQFVDPSGNSFWSNLVDVIKDIGSAIVGAGSAIGDFFATDVAGFFSNTVADFFSNDVAGFFSNDVANFFTNAGNTIFTSVLQPVGAFFADNWKSCAICGVMIVCAAIDIGLTLGLTGLTGPVLAGSLSGGISGFLEGFSIGMIEGSSLEDALISGGVGFGTGSLCGGLFSAVDKSRKAAKASKAAAQAASEGTEAASKAASKAVLADAGIKRVVSTSTIAIKVAVVSAKMSLKELGYTQIASEWGANFTSSSWGWVKNGAANTRNSVSAGLSNSVVSMVELKFGY